MRWILSWETQRAIQTGLWAPGQVSASLSLFYQLPKEHLLSSCFPRCDENKWCKTCKAWHRNSHIVGLQHVGTWVLSSRPMNAEGAQEKVSCGAVWTSALWRQWPWMYQLGERLRAVWARLELLGALKSSPAAETAAAMSLNHRAVPRLSTVPSSAARPFARCPRGFPVSRGWFSPLVWPKETPLILTALGSPTLDICSHKARNWTGEEQRRGDMVWAKMDGKGGRHFEKNDLFRKSFIFKFLFYIGV